MSRRLRVVAVFSAAVLVASIAVAMGRGAPRAHRSSQALTKSQQLSLLRGHATHPEPREDVLGALNWFYGQRMAPGTHLLPQARLAALRQALRIPVARQGSGSVTASPARSDAPVVGGAWTDLGPAPEDHSNPTYNDPYGGDVGAGWHASAGRVTAIAVPKGSETIAYAGFAFGGVWKTTDSGTTWTPVGDKLPSLSIGALALRPGTSRTLYVGTGEANTNADSYWGAGVFVTRDGGNTFTKIGGNRFNEDTVFRIRVHKFKGKPDRIYVATDRGLDRSNDGGKHWKRVLYPGGSTDPTGNFVSDVVELPGYGGTKVLAAVGWRGGDANNGLWLSTDAGKTFKNVTGGASGFTAQSSIGRISLAVTNKKKDLIYAAVQSASCFNAPTGFCPPGTVFDGVYKTTAGPAGPWNMMADSNAFASTDNSAQNPAKIGPGYQPGIGGWYNLYVEIDPTNPDSVVVGLEEIYYTSDGGSNWETIGRYWNFCNSPGPPNCGLDPDDHRTTHPDQHAAAFSVVGGKPKLWVGSDGGMWSQTGPGFNNDDWANLNSNLSTTQPYYVDASGDGTAYIGTQDNGTIKYTGTATWPVVFGGDGGDVATDPATADNVFEEYVYLSMSSSKDGGKTWTQMGPPDEGSGSTARFIAPFDIDPTDTNHVVAVGENVWESTKGFDTSCDQNVFIPCDWTSSYDMGAGHLGTALGVYGHTIYAGWCGPCNPSVPNSTDAGFASGLFSNVGGTWHALAGTLPNRYVSSVTIDPANDMHIFVTLSSFSRHWIPTAGYGHVFESTDGGVTFTDISSDLPDAPANDTVLLSGQLYVGTDVGVFIRSGGGNWLRLGTGFPNVATVDLVVVPGTSTLLAGTHGRGVWSLDV